MKIALMGRRKLGFVDGTYPRNSIKDHPKDLWDKVNGVVLAWIMNSVAKDMLSSVVYCINASHVWRDLGERFKKPHGT